MRNLIYKSYCEYCSQAKENIEIEVKFVHVPILGSKIPQYKRHSFECSIWNCKLNGDMACPIFDKVPITCT